MTFCSIPCARALDRTGCPADCWIFLYMPTLEGREKIPAIDRYLAEHGLTMVCSAPNTCSLALAAAVAAWNYVVS